MHETLTQVSAFNPIEYSKYCSSKGKKNLITKENQVTYLATHFHYTFILKK